MFLIWLFPAFNSSLDRNVLYKLIVLKYLTRQLQSSFFCWTPIITSDNFGMKKIYIIFLNIDSCTLYSGIYGLSTRNNVICNFHKRKLKIPRPYLILDVGHKFIAVFTINYLIMILAMRRVWHFQERLIRAVILIR